MEAIEAAYWMGAGAILLLTMVIFVDKKNHTELMIWLKAQNDKEAAKLRRQCQRVSYPTMKALK